MSKTKLTISIDDELKTRMKIIAIKEKKTVSEIITELVQNYIEDYDWHKIFICSKTKEVIECIVKLCCMWIREINHLCRKICSSILCISLSNLCFI